MNEKDGISITKLICHVTTTLSFLFVIIYLFNSNLLFVTSIELRPIPFICSLLLVFAGFMMASFSWKHLLHLNGYNLRFWQCLYTVGMSVFAKYVPGKIWSALGRASLTAGFGVPIEQAILISMHLLMLFISTGLILGTVGLAFSGKFGFANLGVCVLVIGLIILSIRPGCRSVVLKVAGKLLKKEIVAFPFGIGPFLRVMCLFFLQWGCWSLGFYFLSKALVESHIPIISTSLAFPLSVCLGILSVISPGGIGVREGVLVAALGVTGFSISDSTLISVFARLWYLAGEVSIFLLAFFIKRTIRTSLH